jgi:hypothetical protein
VKFAWETVERTVGGQQLGRVRFTGLKEIGTAGEGGISMSINLPLFSTVVPAIIINNSWDDGGK